MTLYLTDTTSPEDIVLAKQSGMNILHDSILFSNNIRIRNCVGVVYAAKLYPAGATTNSEMGVTVISKISSVLQVCATQSYASKLANQILPIIGDV